VPDLEERRKLLKKFNEQKPRTDGLQFPSTSTALPGFFPLVDEVLDHVKGQVDSDIYEVRFC
jgi:hypothetical protein